MIDDARQLLLENHSGTLSTQSQKMLGYPFGSVVPYCLDGEGLPIILISNIAEHYHNIQTTPKVSLLVIEKNVDDVQTAKRLTWVADVQAVAVDDDAVINEYYRCFPALSDYHKTLGFYFFRLVPVRVCYIAGFGKIHWYDGNQWL